MARYWSGNIGGIDLLDLDNSVAGFELTGAGAFVSNWTGNTRPGMLGNPQTQYSVISGNKTLELKFLHIPQVLAQALLDLLLPVIPSGGTVICEFTDGFQTITGAFAPKMPLSQFYERGLPDGDYLNDFILRLVNKTV